jgi:small-conductance mechanosensitive channel
MIGVPLAVLLACLLGTYLTRGVMESVAFRDGETAGSGLVDQGPWQTVAAVAPLAHTAEEKALALQAERLADHEVDQAFAMGLRRADMETRVLTGAALELRQKVNTLTQMVKEDQVKVDGLTAESKKPGAPESISDDLEVAKSQLQLDSDQLNDTNDDLARESGDKRGQLQQELTAREESMKKYDAQLSGGEVAVISEQRDGTLAGRVDGWFGQCRRRALLEQAKAQADADVAKFTMQHRELESRSTKITDKLKDAAGRVTRTAASVGSKQDADASEGGANRGLSKLTQIHQLAQLHSILDDRIGTEQQLSATYGKWIAQVALQHMMLSHLILQSVAWIAVLVLCGVLVWWMVQKMLNRSTMDPRSLHTLRTIASMGIQLVTLLLVLLVIFGAPKQVPTILGLATAGLTVVFQDFILAFFGWFVLMGKDGIRVGDWVEINGVGGEVVEIGLFRTVLLETGNWTDKGHPTGRRVTFINNFAVTGQYFNFSTAGQWMWDEISVNVPPGAGSQNTIEAIEHAVFAETQADAKLAELEWKDATRVRGLSQFSAAPSVDLRPAPAGIDVLVRYVTRAGNRFEMRNKLYGAVLALLRQSNVPGDSAART